MTKLPEEQLWTLLLQGDISAFEQLYDRYSLILYRYASSISGDAHLVEDCIQELFTRLWEKRKTISVTSSVRFYLLSSIRRMVIRKLQQQNKRSQYEKGSDGFIFEGSLSPEHGYILQEEDNRLQHILLNAINALPVNQREIMYLRYYQSLSFDEIASLTGVEKKTAYNLVFIALRNLKKKLGHLFHLLFAVHFF